VKVKAGRVMDSVMMVITSVDVTGMVETAVVGKTHSATVTIASV